MGDAEVPVLRALVAGDRVRLVSPASTPDQAWVEECAATLSSWGLVPEVGVHALDEQGIYAGPDQARLEDLDDALRDPGVRAVFATRGGAGAYRIADDIDVAAAKGDPKPVIGFSDITFIHLALWHHGALSGVHGSLAGARAQQTVRHLLMEPQPLDVDVRDDDVSSPVVAAGRARVRLVGGNLAAVATSVGVRLPDLDGAILFLEAQRTIGVGLLDRWLTQLRRSGALDRVAGVALGSFEGFRDYTDRDVTAVDVLTDHLCHLGVPVLGGVFAGHDLTDAAGEVDQCALPVGGVATLDATARTLTVDPIVR